MDKKLKKDIQNLVEYVMGEEYANFLYHTRTPSCTPEDVIDRKAMKDEVHI